MRKSSLTLVAVCLTPLWVGAGYTQSDPRGAGTGFAQTVASEAGVGFPQPARSCSFFFKPQRLPATGQTTSYVADDDGDIRAGATLKYRDNGDGTVTDENTNLMWEKKDQTGGGLHNWDNTYPWEGTCSNKATTLCGTDADCSIDGTCNVSGGKMTIFQWVAQLNTPPCFAHHCDWRIPNVKELQSIVDYETYLPPVDAAFNNNCSVGCSVDGTNDTRKCSCTQSAGPSKGYYWSGSTYAPSPIVPPPGSMLAWGVLFGDGDVLSAGKTDDDYVRAVRCGFVRSGIR
jgi:hypothetical protein